MANQKSHLSTAALYQCIEAKHTTHFPKMSIGQFFADFQEFLGRDIRYLSDDAILDKMDKFVYTLKCHNRYKETKHG